MMKNRNGLRNVTVRGVGSMGVEEVAREIGVAKSTVTNIQNTALRKVAREVLRGLKPDHTETEVAALASSAALIDIIIECFRMEKQKVTSHHH